MWAGLRKYVVRGLIFFSMGMVGSDYTKNGGGLVSSLRGDITLPRTGWEYTPQKSDWRADNTLYIDY